MVHDVSCGASCPCSDFQNTELSNSTGVRESFQQKIPQVEAWAFEVVANFYTCLRESACLFPIHKLVAGVLFLTCGACRKLGTNNIDKIVYTGMLGIQMKDFLIKIFRRSVIDWNIRSNKATVRGRYEMHIR